MTTLAWDGAVLAADKRATIGSVKTCITKIARGRRGNLVGVCGTASMIEGIWSWLLNGGPRPEGMSGDDGCGVIEIDPDGTCWKHERHGRFRVEAPFFAAGSGADFALAAMSLGCGAAQAVEVACRFDVMSGDGVDALELAPPKPARRTAPKRRTRR